MEKLASDERETHLNIMADDRDVWYVSSNDPVMIRRLEGVGAVPYKIIKDTRFYLLNGGQVSLRRERYFTTEQKIQMSERGKSLAARKWQDEAAIPDEYVQDAIDQRD